MTGVAGGPSSSSLTLRPPSPAAVVVDEDEPWLPPPAPPRRLRASFFCRAAASTPDPVTMAPSGISGPPADDGLEGYSLLFQTFVATGIVRTGESMKRLMELKLFKILL